MILIRYQLVYRGLTHINSGFQLSICCDIITLLKLGQKQIQTFDQILDTASHIEPYWTQLAIL